MLAELQAAVAAALQGRTPPPDGVEVASLRHARRALLHKRRRAAAYLLPQLRDALGEGWRARFREHAGRYTPCGLLHHVDDAWAFALFMRSSDDSAVRNAAGRDLRHLRRHYSRSRRRDAWRIRPRQGSRGILLARRLTRSLSALVAARPPAA